jgi:Trypsin
MRLSRLSLLSLVLLATPAEAVMRGKVTRDPNGSRSSVVQVESSRGELCSGVVIAPDLVLTAAHCVTERATYRVVAVDRRFRRLAIPAVAAAMHPAFVAGTTPRTQPGVDLAILKLSQPLGRDFVPIDPRTAGRAGKGQPVALAGFGVVGEGHNRSARVLRETQLVNLGELQVANRVMVVADAQRRAQIAGAGACRGDSGGPIFSGGRLVGIVSWSSGALMSRDGSACGGLTAVTPLADHSGWIAARAADLRARSPRQAIAYPAAPASEFDWSAR